MTRSELIAEMAARFPQLSQSDAEHVVLTVLDILCETMIRGQRIEIRGFGSFSVKQRGPRIGRNPRNGVSVTVPPKRVLHFKPGKSMRLKVDSLSSPNASS